MHPIGCGTLRGEYLSTHCSVNLGNLILTDSSAPKNANKVTTVFLSHQRQYEGTKYNHLESIGET
jgi:hypothetical protein